METQHVKQKSCKEIAIFKVPASKQERVKQLSIQIFAEMNEHEVVVIDYEILQNLEKPDEICWLLTWQSWEAAKATTKHWPNFPSTKELESLVGENLYYGHFKRLSSSI